MYDEGRLTVREIAGEFGVSAGTMSIYLRELRAANGGIDYLHAISKPRRKERKWLNT
jgi:transcriptional regulator with XRE-family HTH domain